MPGRMAPSPEANPQAAPRRLAFADRPIAHSVTIRMDQPWQRAHLGGRPVPAAESVKAAQAKTQTWDMQCSGDR
jgi:hypothetical protein